MIIDLDLIFYLWKCDINKTEEIKKILEEKQRNKFKDLEYKKEEYIPKYFKKEKMNLVMMKFMFIVEIIMKKEKKEILEKCLIYLNIQLNVAFVSFWCFKNKKELKKNKKKKI